MIPLLTLKSVAQLNAESSLEYQKQAESPYVTTPFSQDGSTKFSSKSSRSFSLADKLHQNHSMFCH